MRAIYKAFDRNLVDSSLMTALRIRWFLLIAWLHQVHRKLSRPFQNKKMPEVKMPEEFCNSQLLSLISVWRASFL